MKISTSRARVAVLGLATAITVMGCVTAFGQATAKAPATATATAKAAVVISTKIPPSIIDAGEFAENIYDAAKDGDWKLATQKIEALKKAVAQISTEIPYMTANQAKNKTILVEDIAALEKAVADKDKQTALELANEGTLAALNLSSAFNPKVPAAVIRLDYLGRELQVWAGPNDLAKLQKTASSIQSTWKKVLPLLEEKGATEVAKKFAEAINLVAAAKTAKEYEAASVPLLDEVDNLEKVFK